MLIFIQVFRTLKESEIVYAGVFTMQFGLEIVGSRWPFGVPAERDATMPVEAPSTQSTTIVPMVDKRHRARSFCKFYR